MELKRKEILLEKYNGPFCRKITVRTFLPDGSTKIIVLYGLVREIDGKIIIRTRKGESIFPEEFVTSNESTNIPFDDGGAQ